MPAPTVTIGLDPEAASRVVQGLRDQGYDFIDTAETDLMNALVAGGGRVRNCYRQTHNFTFVVRPPLNDHTGEHGVRLYVSRGGYNALLEPEAAQKFKRVPPEHSTETLELVFLRDGGGFAFGTNCAPGYVHVTFFWDLTELDLAALSAA